jgi:hypothetical protein
MKLELNPENCNLVYTAITELSPNVRFSGNGITYESISTKNDCDIGFSKEEFEAKLQELIYAQPWKELRKERNKRLTECDWVAMKAFTTDTPVPDEWKVYMQALRDLPANTTDPENPVWPEPPK